MAEVQLDELMTDEDFVKAVEQMSVTGDADIGDLLKAMNENRIISWEEAERILQDTSNQPVKSSLPEQTRPTEPDNDTDVDRCIQRLLDNDPTLKEVNLNNMKRTPVPQIRRLIEALAYNEHCERISFANMGLYDNDVAVLVTVVEMNQGLKKLNLETNYLSGDFFSKLFKAALVNMTLEEIKAVNQGTTFSTVSEREIIDAVIANTGLIKVSVNLRLPEGRHKIEHATLRNGEIRRVKRREAAMLARQQEEEKRKAEEASKATAPKPAKEPTKTPAKAPPRGLPSSVTNPTIASSSKERDRPIKMFGARNSVEEDENANSPLKVTMNKPVENKEPPKRIQMRSWQPWAKKSIEEEHVEKEKPPPAKKLNSNNWMRRRSPSPVEEPVKERPVAKKISANNWIRKRSPSLDEPEPEKEKPPVAKKLNTSNWLKQKTTSIDEEPEKEKPPPITKKLNAQNWIRKKTPSLEEPEPEKEKPLTPKKLNINNWMRRRSPSPEEEEDPAKKKIVMNKPAQPDQPEPPKRLQMRSLHPLARRQSNADKSSTPVLTIAGGITPAGKLRDGLQKTTNGDAKRSAVINGDVPAVKPKPAVKKLSGVTTASVTEKATVELNEKPAEKDSPIEKNAPGLKEVENTPPRLSWAERRALAAAAKEKEAAAPPPVPPKKTLASPLLNPSDSLRKSATETSHDEAAVNGEEKPKRKKIIKKKVIRKKKKPEPVPEEPREE